MGIDIHLTLEESKGLKSLWGRLKNYFRQDPNVRSMYEACEILQDSARFYAPQWQGELEESILYSVEEISETEFSAEVFTDHPGAQAQERGVPPGFWMWADDFDWWVLDNWGAGGEDEDDYAGLSGFGLTLWLYENGLEAKWFFARAVDDNFVRISAMFDDAAELIIQERD